jgi:GH24 family phage-related lysozyme (muramidase)
MKTSQNGVNLIKSFEGLVLHAYKPVSTEKYWTIGYGHYGSDVREGSTVSKEEAEQLLKYDLGKYEYGVSQMVKVPLNVNQFDSLVSFAYNCGLEALRSSTLLKKLNAGDYQGAANEFSKWVNAGGKQLAGLVRRRAEEKALFLKPIPKPVIPKAKIVTHKVKKGENLTMIAHVYKTTIDKILKQNTNIKNANLIYIGQNIKVPDNR